MMFHALTFCHSFTRWLVLASLMYAIFRACKGYVSKSVFNKTDNLVRHWTATIAHLQLIIGILLYTQSAIVRYFWKNLDESLQQFECTFYGLIHIVFMLIAIICITIGSSLSKRKPTDHQKYKTMLVWFLIAFVLIFIAIPWPFSPLSNRPYLR